MTNENDDLNTFAVDDLDHLDRAAVIEQAVEAMNNPEAEGFLVLIQKAGGIESFGTLGLSGSFDLVLNMAYGILDTVSHKVAQDFLTTNQALLDRAMVKSGVSVGSEEVTDDGKGTI